MGKTNLAAALGYHACLKGHTMLFCSAVDAINNLAAAQSAGHLKQELKKYYKPALLILDELLATCLSIKPGRICSSRLFTVSCKIEVIY